MGRVCGLTDHYPICDLLSLWFNMSKLMIQRKVFNYTKIPKKVGALGDPHRFKGAVSKTPQIFRAKVWPPQKLKTRSFCYLIINWNVDNWERCYTRYIDKFGRVKSLWKTWLMTDFRARWTMQYHSCSIKIEYFEFF